jgi:pimeloyl-ACP methyl ester carboxylesterase
MQDPARAYAGSQWYRAFQAREALQWLRGEYADARVEVPLRWVTGLKDPVITPTLHRWYETRATDIAFEHVPGVGHWIVEEAHDLVLDRRTFLKEWRVGPRAGGGSSPRVGRSSHPHAA